MKVSISINDKILKIDHKVLTIAIYRLIYEYMFIYSNDRR